VGFEPTIPAFERAKTVHALDRADSVTGTVQAEINKSNHLIQTPFISHAYKHVTILAKCPSVRLSHYVSLEWPVKEN
jgi:hypothetical protein